MKRFPAKLLLFGEYGLLFGAKALALPFHAFSGQLSVDNEIPTPESKTYSSYLEIDRFVSFFDYHGLNREMFYPIEIEVLKEDLSIGLHFNSDIPFEYGVGSSGALCAAIFDKYSVYRKESDKFSRNKGILESLMNDFSVMERYFHGTSSGVDPLVSFLDRPVLIQNGNATIVDFSIPDDFSIFLIDTEQKGSTGSLVENFRKKMNDLGFSELFNRDYIQLNDDLVNSTLTGDLKTFSDSLMKLVLFQLEHFSAMIPSNFYNLIKKLHSEGIYVKLLGSGGGGYLLAFVPKSKTLTINTPVIKLNLPGN